MEEYLLYPVDNLRVTQSPSGTPTHILNSTGNPKDYPWDEGGLTGGTGVNARNWFICRNEWIVRRIYGVGNSGVNTIWIETKNKVKIANGKTTYVTLMIVHPNDDDLSKLKVGQILLKNSKPFREGKDGATAYHFHFSGAGCQFKALPNNGWVKNSKGAWVISANALRPEELFYINRDLTSVHNMLGIPFKNVPPESNPDSNPSPASQTHIVVKGDTLSKIAQKYYGKNTAVYYNFIAEANGIPTTGKNKHLIVIGQKLTIPAFDSNHSVLAVGNKVKIIAGGNAQTNGKGKSAGGIGKIRYITKIYTGQPFPYQVGNRSSTASKDTTGFYKATALQKQ